jgi:hypothetical protein
MVFVDKYGRTFDEEQLNKMAAWIIEDLEIRILQT